MADRPLLTLSPQSKSDEKQSSRGGLGETVKSPGRKRQLERLDPQFQRLEDCLNNPQKLLEMQADPAAIVPERALVFEIASSIVDFNQAIKSYGFEFYGEIEVQMEATSDFQPIEDKKAASGKSVSGHIDLEMFPAIEDEEIIENKLVTNHAYFTIPDRQALDELVSLWKRYKKGDQLEGRKVWKKVFEHLVDVRPWGPKDRVTEDVKRYFEEQLHMSPEEPIRIEIEFWYRNNQFRREEAKNKFEAILASLHGEIISYADISEIKYNAILAEITPSIIRELLDSPETHELVNLDHIMFLRYQAETSTSIDIAHEYIREIDSKEHLREPIDTRTELVLPVAALLDGRPMDQHVLLANRLDIDDPDNLIRYYGSASDQIHGTTMASIILHGDLNNPTPLSQQSKLYIRPVLVPDAKAFGDSKPEMIPNDQLAIDMIWRAFKRMFEGDGSEAPIASQVRIVNLSICDSNRAFAGVMSPWARLLDYLAWEYKILILVSAGNIKDGVTLDNIDNWIYFKELEESNRQTIILEAIESEKANRCLLSPSESINSLTIGASHMDYIIPSNKPVVGMPPVAPYKNKHLPNLSSALGLGFRRSIKPEILFPGGAELVQCISANKGNSLEIVPVKDPRNNFGIGAACPSPDESLRGFYNTSGTSAATAMATHSALRIYEALEGLQDSIDSSFYPVLLKTLLVHSARWNEEAEESLKAIIQNSGKMDYRHKREHISRFLGYGTADIERVLECSINRVTLIGWNAISPKDIDEFLIPFPEEIQEIHGHRAVTTTVAWLTPTVVFHRKYHAIKFEIENDLHEFFSKSRHQPYHDLRGKGTVYHQRFESEKGIDPSVLSKKNRKFFYRYIMFAKCREPS